DAHAALDDVGQQLTGAADKRLAAGVFVGAGRLADEHQLRVGIADAEDEIDTARRELASLTISDELTQLVERRGFFESGIFRKQFGGYECRVGPGGWGRRTGYRSRRGGHGARGLRPGRRKSFHPLLPQLLDVVADRSDQLAAIRRRRRVHSKAI